MPGGIQAHSEHPIQNPNTNQQHKSQDDVVAQFHLKEQYPVGDDYMLIREIG